MFHGQQLPGHHNIGWELNADSRFDPRGGTYDELLAELRASDAPTIVLSSEVFGLLSNRYDSLVRMAHDLAECGFVPRIVAYLRSRTEYATSLYGELVRSQGLCASFESFTANILTSGFFGDGPLRYYLRYRDLLEPFSRAFGAESVSVLPFHREAPVERLLENFFCAIGSSKIVDRSCVSRQNSASSFIDLLMQLHHNLKPSADLRPDPIDLLLEALPTTSDRSMLAGPFDLFDDDEATRFENAFAADDAGLLECYQCAVPASAKRSLMDTEKQARALRAQVYRMAVRLWIAQTENAPTTEERTCHVSP